jgi:regulator of protease activity HflC (stomatin/prohibitin superfamily)
MYDVLIFVLEVLGLSLAIFAVLGLGFVVYKCFTLVNEGTAKIVVRLGAYKKTLLAKKGSKLDNDDNVVELAPGEKEPPHLPGGLRFIGFWPFDRVYTYDFKWVKALSDGRLEDREEKGVDFTLVKDYVYGMRVLKAEDADLLHLSVFLTLTSKIVNPRKAHFNVNAWFNAFVSRVAPYVRDFVTKASYTVLEKKNLQESIFAALKRDGIIDELRENYGIELLKVEVVDIDPPEELRNATLEKWQAERDVERDKTKRLGSTSATLMAMIADQTGVDAVNLRAEFAANPNGAAKKYAALLEMNKDFIEQQIATDAGAMRRYYFTGAKGGLDLIALLGDVFRGAGLGGGRQRVSAADSSDEDESWRQNLREEYEAELEEEDEEKKKG